MLSILEKKVCATRYATGHSLKRSLDKPGMKCLLNRSRPSLTVFLCVSKPVSPQEENISKIYRYIHVSVFV